MARPHRMQREHWVEEQRGWAASSEKRSAQYMESIAFRSGKALGGAGAVSSSIYESSALICANCPCLR